MRVVIAICLTLLVIGKSDLNAQPFYQLPGVLEVGFSSDTTTYFFIGDPSLYQEGWALLPQISFWRTIIRMDPLISAVNIVSNRKILSYIPTSQYTDLEIRARNSYKDSVRKSWDLHIKTPLYVTQGMRHYYQFPAVLSDIHHGVRNFQQMGTDPWYAQAILLIESPGVIRTSPSGARGPFQLMPFVARSQGLVVTKEIDERVNFDKSARAAATFIRDVCLPQVRTMLERWDLEYRENDLWFRLLVLHTYHAGGGAVRSALRSIRPTEGGMPLIRKLWSTQTRYFRNASQNYSQIALAALLELEELIYERGGFIVP